MTHTIILLVYHFVLILHPLNFKYIRMSGNLLWPPMSTNAEFYSWRASLRIRGGNQYPYDIMVKFLAVIFIVSTVPVVKTF